MTATAEMTMAEVLEAYPGAQRALFKNYHIGGCASCGFRPDETLADVCRRNGGLDPEGVLEKVRVACQEDERMMIAPAQTKRLLASGEADLLDIRSREEYDAVRLEGAQLLDQAMLQEMIAHGPRERLLVIVDHKGLRSLDAAAYFAGHGFTNVRCLRGGIDAWSTEVDPGIPRYTLE